MKLISCTIENFGKLNNVTYDFSGECNTICEDNGWGKSTLASFIRVMFYGFKNESKKKLVDKERNRLMPWQKGVYGGEIVFELVEWFIHLEEPLEKSRWMMNSCL